MTKHGNSISINSLFSFETFIHLNPKVEDPSAAYTLH